jgi:hypothetical protein
MFKLVREHSRLALILGVALFFAGFLTGWRLKDSGAESGGPLIRNPSSTAMPNEASTPTPSPADAATGTREAASSTGTPVYEVHFDSVEKCSAARDGYFAALSPSEQEQVKAYWKLEPEDRARVAQQQFDERGVDPSLLLSAANNSDFPVSSVGPEDPIAKAVARSVSIVDGTVEKVEFHYPSAVILVKITLAVKGDFREGSDVRVRVPWFIEYDPSLPPECQLIISYPPWYPPTYAGGRLLLLLQRPAPSGSPADATPADAEPLGPAGYNRVAADGLVDGEWSVIDGRPIDDVEADLKSATG